MAYRALLWPLRMLSNGDFESGGLEAVTRSDIRTAFQTRKFVNLRKGGERAMRPGAFCALPAKLFDTMIPEIQIPLFHQQALEAMAHVAAQGKIRVLSVIVTEEPPERGYFVASEYEHLHTGERETYGYEIATETIPVPQGGA